MKIILLSGGSGKRLWPLSNEARSKQFLKLLPSPAGDAESMVQRVVRQIENSSLEAQIIVATSESQRDSISNQLAGSVDVVTEPERRHTFAAIALATAYLDLELNCPKEEIVIVIPVDAYAEQAYFDVVLRMAQALERGEADLLLMGIPPRKASQKFGYILPSKPIKNDGSLSFEVDKFEEKPSFSRAQDLIEQGAYWNGGVFTFRLGYVRNLVSKYIKASDYQSFRAQFSSLPQNSFDREVLEKSRSLALVPFEGDWCDLGSWSSLADHMAKNSVGKVLIGEGVQNSYVLNELDIPIICLGAKDLIVAASPDGILVSEREASVNLKNYAKGFSSRPMYEERRWGRYKVMGYNAFEDGHKVLTKQLCLNAGCNISYQYHLQRDEIWTFVDGEGLLVVDGELREVGRGYVAHIKAGQRHAVKAKTDLQIIEVQSGRELVEEDIVRLDWTW